jgi:hypothetical protein
MKVLVQHIEKILAIMEKSTNPTMASSQPSATTGKSTETSTAPELPLKAPLRKYTRPKLSDLYVAEHPNCTRQEMNAFSRLILKETAPVVACSNCFRGRSLQLLLA